MAQMTTAQVTEYLKQVSSLETSLYKQEKTREKAWESLKLKEVKKTSINKPVNHAENLPFPQRPTTMSKLEFLIGLGAFLFGLPIFLGIFTGAMDMIGSVLLPMAIFMSAPFLIIGFVSKKRQDAVNEEEHCRLIQEYRKKKEQYEEDYKRALATYNNDVVKADNVYQQNCAIAKRNYDKARAEVITLDPPLQQTKELLEKIYSADVIFPKYRNMVAICTMYEYFASGRCTELTGANGAYNLYEAELRQNIIINQLETVNLNLKQVKQNQFILYQGITEANQALREISNDVKQMVVATNDIAVSSRIAAYCSQITAANVQAQTYLAIMN